MRNGSGAALRFLLQYQNVNVHVRDSCGDNLLLFAVWLECESCIQSLLDFGVSMTDEDEDGISAFKCAVERCCCTEPLLALLRHAAKDGREMDAVMALNRDALYKLCCQQPFRRAHAAILVRCGWSLATSMDNTSLLRLVLDIFEEEQRLLMLMLEQTRTILEIRAKASIWNEVLMTVTKGPKGSTAVLLKLLRAGIEYQHLKLEIYGLAIMEEDHLLLAFLDRRAARKILREVATNTEGDLHAVVPNSNKPPILTNTDDSEAVTLHVADVTHSDAILHRPQRTRALDFLKHHRSGADSNKKQELDPKHARLVGLYSGHIRHCFPEPDPKLMSSETRKTRSRILPGDEQSITVNGGFNHVCYKLDAVETQIRHEKYVPQCHDTDSLPGRGKKAKRKQDRNLSRSALAAFQHLRLAEEILQGDAWVTPPFQSPIQATL